MAEDESKGRGGGGFQQQQQQQQQQEANNNSSSSSSGELMTMMMANNNALVLDSVPPGLKHDTGLAVEWSLEEQYMLEDGLVKYANEPHIMQYIKIASSLHDKTVRDVALRCRWMTRKRRKQDDQNLGKKVKDSKEKLESFLKNSVSPTLSRNMPAHFLTANHHHQNDMLSGALSCTKTRHLLEENSEAFGRISSNISTLKLQENVDLFFRTRNNIASILNEMQNMPGIISRMPPLPVFLDEELAGRIFPRSSQPMMFGSSSMVPLKQEPGF